MAPFAISRPTCCPSGSTSSSSTIRRIGRVPGANGDGLQRILMAAARVDGIDRLMQALDTAGLRAQGIALSGLAMVSALDHALLPGEAILYVQAGALTNVVITEDGQPLLVRAASAGSEAIATGLAERAGISHEAARAHIATIGLGTGGPGGHARRARGERRPAGPRGPAPRRRRGAVLARRLRRTAGRLRHRRGRPDRLDDDMARRRPGARGRAAPAGDRRRPRELAADRRPRGGPRAPRRRRRPVARHRCAAARPASRRDEVEPPATAAASAASAAPTQPRATARRSSPRSAAGCSRSSSR